MKRYNNYDLLRVVACISVILIHVSFGLLSDSDLSKSGLNYLGIVFFNTISRFAVPVFIMISGAFLLSNKKNSDYTYFYKKSFKKIGVPTIIFSLFYFVYYLLLNLIQIKLGTKNTSSMLEPVVGLLTGAPYYHLWYLYTIVGLYALTPIIIRIKETISLKSYKIIAIILLILSIIGNLSSTHVFTYDIGNMVYYIGYFIIGDILKNEIGVKKSNKKFVLLFMLSFIPLLLLTPIHYYFAVKGMNSFTTNIIQGNFNPLIVISSILMFYSFSFLDFRYEFKKLPQYSLYMYIFHVIPCDFIFKVMKYLGYIDKFSHFGLIILGTLFCFFISFIMSSLWLKIYVKITNMLNKKVV